MGRFALVELCAGSAALTLHLLGMRRQLVPYQGSKWKLRKGLGQILQDRDHTELSAVFLNDLGPWGCTWQALSDPEQLEWVIAHVRTMDLEKPHIRAHYDRLHKEPIPIPMQNAMARFAAEHLFLQRLSINGKAVGTSLREGRECWNSPGFNGTSAHGTAAKASFGAVKPMIPALIRQLEFLRTLTWPKVTISTQQDARTTSTWGDLNVQLLAGLLPCVVLLDPNYIDSTGYPNGTLSREKVIAIARTWERCAATVLICEAEPIAELVADGWETRCLREPPADTKPFQSKKAEWVTISPKRAE